MKDIKEQRAFELYMAKERETTDICIDEHVRMISRYEEWCVLVGIEEKEYISRAVITDYIEFMKLRELAVGTYNCTLSSLKIYYEFLKFHGVLNVNPARGLTMGGKKDTVVKDPFSDEELLDLYLAYCEHRDARTKHTHLVHLDEVNLMYKLIVSLVVFQGLHTGELDALQVDHVAPKQGSIFIPATGKCKQRTLKLHQVQMFPFKDYLDSLPEHQEKLFSIQVQKSFDTRLQELRGLCPKLKNLRHIRGSKIITWTKIHGKLEAQKMIGHRWVSSTEAYEQQDLSDIEELTSKTHLFN